MPFEGAGTPVESDSSWVSIDDQGTISERQGPPSQVPWTSAEVAAASYQDLVEQTGW